MHSTSEFGGGHNAIHTNYMGLFLNEDRPSFKIIFCWIPFKKGITISQNMYNHGAILFQIKLMSNIKSMFKFS